MSSNLHYEVNDCSPQILENYIGQQRVVSQLRICLENSWNDGVRLPHTLLNGEAGLGKTQISVIAAAEMGVVLKEQLAQNLTTPALLKGFLLESLNKDVLLIDEIHQLSPLVQTTLFRALEDRKIFINGNHTKKTHTLKLANFTLLGATTDAHMLLKPLRERFRLTLHFETYSQDELNTILTQRCRQLGWEVQEEVLTQLSARGRGVPRTALRLLESTRRVSRSLASDIIKMNHFKIMCRLEGLDNLGLNILDRKYLFILSEYNGPIRLNIIASRLDFSNPKTVVEMIEKYLIKIGFVDKDDKGRHITPSGLAHIRNNPIE